MDFTHSHTPDVHTLHQGLDVFTDSGNPLEDKPFSSDKGHKALTLKIQDHIDGFLERREKLLGDSTDHIYDIHDLHHDIFSRYQDIFKKYNHDVQGDELLGKHNGNDNLNGTKDILVGDSGKGDVDTLTGLGSKKESVENPLPTYNPEPKSVPVDSSNSSDKMSPDMNSGNKNSSDKMSPDLTSEEKNSSEVNSSGKNSSDKMSPDMNSENKNSSDKMSPDLTSEDKNPSEVNSSGKNSSDKMSPDMNSGNKNSSDKMSPDLTSEEKNSSEVNSSGKNSSDKMSPDMNSENKNSSDKMSPDLTSEDKNPSEVTSSSDKNSSDKMSPDVDSEQKKSSDSISPDVTSEKQNSSEVNSSDKISGDTTLEENNSFGNKYYVSVNGSDNNPGTKDKPWKTIDHAVGKDSPIKAGDTVLVQPGTYTELITLGKSGESGSGRITLKANGDVTLKDPNPTKGGFREGVIQSAGKSHWVIDGFRIENTSWAGISLRDAEDITVQNNHTYETGASGIIVLPDTYYDGGEQEVTSKDIKVLNNTIERANWRWKGRGDTNGTQEALSIWGVDGFEVAGNTVDQGNREGIDAKTGSRNGSIHDNKVTGTSLVSGTPGGYNGGSAIYVDGGRARSFNIDIYNNEVYGNTADAISIADEDPSRGDVFDIRVFNNVVYDNGKQGVNGGQGIGISNNVRDVEIFNNTFSNNVQAITINGKSYTGGYQPRNITVTNNIFADSTYRNGFIEDAKNVTLKNNLFTDRFSNLYDGGKRTTNVKSSDNTEVNSIRFMDSSGHDFHLKSDSAAVDSGFRIDPDVEFDKDGKKRNQGKAIDVGAYESK
ncbi:right-handed parallel beta-helix repeat-containing protein [Mastigocoleus testarum]|uniref:right-handed parallel beta-helix repeat-containing protein n=1 Tax=Mastigocoleus testarum TaxID=996925 RepID=UPI000AD359DC|nr:right-handed parallel beta-helix repeat-containing protein [Mastigocoleus testarum]